MQIWKCKPKQIDAFKKVLTYCSAKDEKMGLAYLQSVDQALKKLTTQITE